MKTRSTTFYCFSPAVMLVTFLIEIIGALYIIWRYKMTTITRLITSILVCLGIFQGAEYMLCGGMGLSAGLWSQVGYSAITLLPPLGLHLSMSISGRMHKGLLYLAYGSAALFIAYFSFMTGSISGHTCYANYVVFSGEHGSLPGLLYGAYYYGWLFVGVWHSFRSAQVSSDKRIRSALVSLGIGYCAFIVPTTAFNIADPSTVAGIPSIMCGFAVLLAFMLLGKVAPESIELKQSSKPMRIKLPF